MNLTPTHKVLIQVSVDFVRSCGHFHMPDALSCIARKADRAWPTAADIRVETVDHVHAPQVDIIGYDSDGFEITRKSNDPLHQLLIVEAIIGDRHNKPRR